LHTKSPSPDVATVLPRLALFLAEMGAAADESADMVEDVEFVLSASARDTGCSSLARFIPAPMDDESLVLVNLLDAWIGVLFSTLFSVVRLELRSTDTNEWLVGLGREAGGALIYRLCEYIRRRWRR
jgi:hypothetical protein